MKRANHFLILKTWGTGSLKKGQKLLFATNRGMYKTDSAPLGLFINESKVITPLNRACAKSNFYLKPNGVFYIGDDNQAIVYETGKFTRDDNIKYATQSGPMLVIDGKIHPSFSKGSTSTNIRNGVGILPNGNILFAMSKSWVNLYDFADYFKKNSFKNALYLDGFVSRTYLPGQNLPETDGSFGGIIAEISGTK